MTRGPTLMLPVMRSGSEYQQRRDAKVLTAEPQGGAHVRLQAEKQVVGNRGRVVVEDGAQRSGRVELALRRKRIH